MEARFTENGEPPSSNFKLDDDMGPSDITLVVSGQNIACHRSRLAASSCYFRAMFASGMQDSDSRFVYLKEVSVDDVRRLVQYIYTSELGLKSSNLCSVLKIAFMLQFDSAVNVCVTFARDHITVDNCLPLASVADSCGLTDLYRNATLHATWFFGDIIKTTAFLQLSANIVKTYLSNSSLNVKDEMHVFDALIAWYEHNADSIPVAPDFVDFVDIFQCVRLNQLSICQLETLKTHHVVTKHPHCVYLVECAMKNYEDDNMQVTSLVGRCVPDELWMAAVRCGELHLRRYSFVENTSQFVTELPTDLRCLAGFQVCVIGKDIYVLGGGEESARRRWLQIVYRFDTFTARWHTVCQLKQPRRHHATVVSGNCIYVIGGFGRHRIRLDSVESYDTCEDSWEEHPSLPETIVNGAACALEQKIFVLKQKLHFLVPRMSTHWTEIPLKVPLCACSAVAVSGDIYLLDQHSDNLTVIHPKKSSYETVCCLFESSIELLCGRGRTSLSCCNGRLYALRNDVFYSHDLVKDTSEQLPKVSVAAENETCLFSVPISPHWPDDTPP